MHAINELLKRKATITLEIVKLAGANRYKVDLGNKCEVPNIIEFMLLSYKFPRLWIGLQCIVFGSILLLGYMKVCSK